MAWSTNEQSADAAITITPLPPNTVVEQIRIDIDPPSLFEGEKKKQVKKQKDAELKLELEKRIREMVTQKRKQKLAEREFNGKKNQTVNIFYVSMHFLCILYNSFPLAPFL